MPPAGTAFAFFHQSSQFANFYHQSKMCQTVSTKTLPTPFLAAAPTISYPPPPAKLLALPPHYLFSPAVSPRQSKHTFPLGSLALYLHQSFPRCDPSHFSSSSILIAPGQSHSLTVTQSHTHISQSVKCPSFFPVASRGPRPSPHFGSPQQYSAHNPKSPYLLEYTLTDEAFHANWWAEGRFRAAA